MYYENDELNREKFVQNLLCHVIAKAQRTGGSTIMLHGNFGSGKSRILKYLKEELVGNATMRVLEYDCWRKKYCEDPLVSLLNIFNQLKDTNDLKKSAIRIIKKVQKVGLTSLTNKIGIDIKDLFDKSSLFDKIDAYEKAILEYRIKLTKQCSYHKIVLIIDELDRCLPDYQIKLLESLHHLLGITGLVVLIAVDKLQLEATIKRQFGNDNVFGYLSKFVDSDINLPVLKDNYYLESLFESANKNSIKFCIKMYELKDMQLRDTERIIKKINNVRKLAYIEDISLEITNFILIIRELHPRIYNNYFVNELQCSSYNNLDYEKVKIEESAFMEFKNLFNDGYVDKLIKMNNNVNFALSLINCIENIDDMDQDSLISYLGNGDIEKSFKHYSPYEVDGYLSRYEINNIIEAINEKIC